MPWNWTNNETVADGQLKNNPLEREGGREGGHLLVSYYWFFPLFLDRAGGWVGYNHSLLSKQHELG